MSTLNNLEPIPNAASMCQCNIVPSLPCLTLRSTGPQPAAQVVAG